MVFWIEVALMVVLSLALWAWLTWRLLEWFERELWAARGAHEAAGDVQPARARSASIVRLEAEISVTGMVCGVCEHQVADALARLEGVREVEADHRAERVIVRYDAERVDERTLRERIAGCGFRPSDRP